jgi:DNA-binding HxlR family transcriptional regulator
MKQRNESKCPICYALDSFGDKWTLLIVRDLLLAEKRYYRDFLKAGEGIATNVLADRLKTMLDKGQIARTEDPDNAAQAIYTPTAKAEALRPVLDAIANWAIEFGPPGLTRFSSLGASGPSPDAC